MAQRVASVEHCYSVALLILALSVWLLRPSLLHASSVKCATTRIVSPHRSRAFTTVLLTFKLDDAGALECVSWGHRRSDVARVSNA